MKYLSLLFFLSFFFSCANNQSAEETSAIEEVPTETINVTPDSKEEEKEVPNAMEDVLGIYVGRFSATKLDESKRPSWSNKINISIDKIEGDKVFGHSVVAGNNRPFEGTIHHDGNSFQVEAKEPGDDRYDGVFSFTIDLMKSMISGTWVANRKTLAVTERAYTLNKRTFQYNPDNTLLNIDLRHIYGTYNEELYEAEFLTKDVWSKNASVDILNKEDVENMHKSDLEVMRNAIYARHGYSFKNRKMRYVFNHVDWYIPMHTDIRSQLTELELQNIELLKRYEQHAERYYDGFGR